MIQKLNKEVFRYLGNYDVSFFEQKLESLDWNHYLDRQEQRYGMRDTNTIPIVWDLDLENICLWPSFKLFQKEILKLEETLATILGKGTIYSCVLTKLPAGKNIDLHRDVGGFFENTNRIHIPVQTNSKVLFRVGNESINMKIGEMWEISNHNKLHGVFNLGETDRIHLMIDWGNYRGSVTDMFLSSPLNIKEE